jgi:SPP1 family predicted phage head-tail adaptor
MAGLERGDFNKRVTFRNYPTTDDEAGGEVEGVGEPDDFLTTWASVEDDRGNRSFEEGEDQLIKRKKISVYHRQLLIEKLKKTTHIIYDGAEYSIDSYSHVDEVKKIIKFRVVGV